MEISYSVESIEQVKKIDNLLSVSVRSFEYKEWGGWELVLRVNDGVVLCQDPEQFIKINERR